MARAIKAAPDSGTTAASSIATFPPHATAYAKTEGSQIGMGKPTRGAKPTANFSSEADSSIARPASDAAPATYFRRRRGRFPSKTTEVIAIALAPRRSIISIRVTVQNVEAM